MTEVGVIHALPTILSAPGARTCHTPRRRSARALILMGKFLATLVLATLVGTSLSACAAAPDPTPVIYWAEARLHVIVKAIEPSANGGTWSVTFEVEGEEMRARTVPGLNRPLLVPGDTAIVLGKISQAGDLLITSITLDRPLERSPGTQGSPPP